MTEPVFLKGTGSISLNDWEFGYGKLNEQIAEAIEEAFGNTFAEYRPQKDDPLMFVHFHEAFRWSDEESPKDQLDIELRFLNNSFRDLGPTFGVSFEAVVEEAIEVLRGALKEDSDDEYEVARNISGAIALRDVLRKAADDMDAFVAEVEEAHGGKRHAS